MNTCKFFYAFLIMAFGLCGPCSAMQSGEASCSDEPDDIIDLVVEERIDHGIPLFFGLVAKRHKVEAVADVSAEQVVESRSLSHDAVLPVPVRATGAFPCLMAAGVVLSDACALYTCPTCLGEFMSQRLLNNHKARCHESSVFEFTVPEHLDAMEVSAPKAKIRKLEPEVLLADFSEGVGSCESDRLQLVECLYLGKRLTRKQIDEHATWANVCYTPEGLCRGLCYQLPYAERIENGGFRCSACHQMFASENLCTNHIGERHMDKKPVTG